MISIDLNKPKNLEFDIKEGTLVKTANFVVEFKNGILYSFPGTTDLEKSEIAVTLPVLKNLITQETEASCYLEVSDDKGAYYRVAKDTVLFVFAKPVEIKATEEEPEPQILYREKKEVELDQKNIELKPISTEYKYNEEKPKRREILASFFVK